MPDLKCLSRSNGRSYTLKDNTHRFLLPDEYMKFEDALKAKQRFAVKLLINTGARIMEAQNIKVNDIIWAVNSGDKTKITLRVTKTKAKKGETHCRPRMIHVSTQFSKYLKKYINEHKLEPDDYLGVLSNAALNIAYKKAGKVVGIKDYWNISSHTFRKTLEVWLMALGVDSLPLTAHLGHDVKTAAQYYVSPDIFSYDDKTRMRMIIGDLYERR